MNNTQAARTAAHSLAAIERLSRASFYVSLTTAILISVLTLILGAGALEYWRFKSAMDGAAQSMRSASEKPPLVRR